MDGIKNALKDAREAINIKDFDRAIQCTKLALKSDKNNYMALVMLGVALQDSEQAPMAFKKAISLSGDKILAWQGLEKYYEKIETVESWRELLAIYTRLLSLETDQNKYIDICNKFYRVSLNLNDVVKCAHILYDHLCTAPAEKQSIAYSTLTKLLVHSKLNIDEETFLLLQNVFQKYSPEWSTCEFLVKYFHYLYLKEGFKYMFQIASDFLKHNNVLELNEFICKTYFENILMEYQIFDSENTEVISFMEDFLNTNAESNLHNFAKAGLFYLKMDYFNAYYIANNLLANDKGNIILTIFTAKCCAKLQRWKEAENISSKLINHPDETVSTVAGKILLVALAYQSNKEKCEKAIELKTKVKSDCLGVSEYSALFTAYLLLDMLPEAESLLSPLQDTPEVHVLTAHLLKRKGRDQEALEILNNNKDTVPLCWFELGLYHWEKKDFEDSLTPFLQAARVDKYNHLVFFYLGEYYRLCDLNLEKAKKCYQKAFSLNPECTQAGKSLSNAYRHLQNWDTGYEFLKNVLNSNQPDSSWAWLALGLHHLELEQWGDAIVNLRTFVRLHPSDAEAWESLADAYYFRGSYTSSLRCYQRATDLDANRKYSLVQIGTVQGLLGLYNEAITTYDVIKDNHYIPALKGKAEVKLCIANDHFAQNLYGSCRDNAQQVIDLMTSAILTENRFVCLWKVLSSAVSIITRLPPKYRWLFINAKFSNENNADKLIFVTEADVFVLAIRCLCKAINLSSVFNSYLYNDLSIMYLEYYKCFGNKNAVFKAYAAIKKCLNTEQNVWQYWNTLGVICMSKGIKKFAIAQHAFLKALNLDVTNSVIWSNLGLLYLYFNKTFVSNKSFQKAQQFDPSYLQSWVGQALVAESVGHQDAMDLFRHSTELGFHKESSHGYAEWVCKTLMNIVDTNQSKVVYSIKNMHAIPMACDLMTWLNEYENENACCLNIFGILLEKMGLYNKALLSFEKALELADSKYKDILFLNCGRTLYHLGKYESAIEMFKSVSEANLPSACGLALSLYKCELYEESYAIYSTALQWLAGNDREKSELLVAMASMAYKFQGIDDCKTLLFQSVQMNKEIPSIPGLLAIYSIGLLHSEPDLSNLVIAELHKLNYNNAYYNYIGFFESYISLKHNPTEAIKKIISFIHTYPDNVYLWQYLSKYCMSTSGNNASLASRSAQKVMVLGCSKENIIQNYRVASVAEMFLNNLKSSIKFAQMAIHMYPNNAENWALLLSVLLPKSSSTPNILWIKKLLGYIKEHLNPTKSTSKWLDFFERHFITIASN